MIAAYTASSSANEVSMMQAISGCCERISRHTSIPSPSGSRTSSTATSGLVAGMRPYGLLGGAGLADDLEVVLGLEQLAQAAAHDLVVVEQEHPGGHGCQSARGRSAGRRRIVLRSAT